MNKRKQVEVNCDPKEITIGSITTSDEDSDSSPTQSRDIMTTQERIRYLEFSKRQRRYRDLMLVMKAMGLPYRCSWDFDNVEILPPFTFLGDKERIYIFVGEGLKDETKTAVNKIVSSCFSFLHIDDIDGKYKLKDFIRYDYEATFYYIEASNKALEHLVGCQFCQHNFCISKPAQHKMAESCNGGDNNNYKCHCSLESCHLLKKLIK